MGDHQEDNHQPQAPCPGRILCTGSAQVKRQAYNENGKFYHCRRDRPVPQTEPEFGGVAGEERQVGLMDDEVQHPVADHAYAHYYGAPDVFFDHPVDDAKEASPDDAHCQAVRNGIVVKVERELAVTGLQAYMLYAKQQ